MYDLDGCSGKWTYLYIFYEYFVPFFRLKFLVEKKDFFMSINKNNCNFNRQWFSLAPKRILKTKMSSYFDLKMKRDMRFPTCSKFHGFGQRLVFYAYLVHILLSLLTHISLLKETKAKGFFSCFFWNAWESLFNMISSARQRHQKVSELDYLSLSLSFFLKKIMQVPSLRSEPLQIARGVFIKKKLYSSLWERKQRKLIVTRTSKSTSMQPYVGVSFFF